MEKKRSLLRRAGDKLNEFDQNYSQKIVDMYIGPEGSNREYMGNPVTGTLAGMGAVFAGGTPVSAMSRKDPLETGAALSSAAAKYVAPAAGVTAAGAGLMSLAEQMTSSANGELPM